MDVHQTGSAAVRPDALEVIRSEEHLVVGHQTRPTGRVRISKRVVTEERTVTVRREELVVEELPADGDRGPGPSAPLGQDGRAADGPVVELVLSEEVLQTVVVPRERVRVYVDAVGTTTTVAADVAREVVDLDVDDATAAAGRHAAAGTRTDLQEHRP